MEVPLQYWIIGLLVLWQLKMSSETPSNVGKGWYDPLQPKGFNEKGIQGQEVAGGRAVEYTALLVGKTVPGSPVTSTNAVGRGHFTLVGNILYFSVHYTKLDNPIIIRFTDERGATFFEQPVHRVKGYKNKVCGVWRQLPNIYITYITSGRLHVVVTSKSHENGEIGGKMIQHRALQEEIFSALLPSSARDGSGGIAMMTLDPEGKGNSLSFVVLSSGLLDADESSADISFEKDNHIVKKVLVSKNTNTGELVEVWPSFSSQDSRQLARGRLSMVIKTGRGREIQGDITPKQTCNSFQSVLSGHESLEETKTGAAGSAVLSLSAGGSLSYQIHLVGMKSPITGLTIEGAPNPNKKDRRKRVSKMFKDFKKEPNSNDGWVRGSYDKPNAREIYLLMKGELYINVQTADHPTSALRGRITQVYYHGHLARHIGHPYVLSGSDVDPPQDVGGAGHAWLGVDRSCILHYEIIVSGINDDNSVNAQLHGTPDRREKQLKDEKITLVGFNGEMVVGRTELSNNFFQLLDRGEAFIQISTKSHPSGQIRANVSMPNKCFTELSPRHHGDLLEDMENNQVDEEPDKKCRTFDGNIYKDGESWLPVGANSCMTCSCKRGREQCLPASCPTPQCKNPVKLEGECCPVCLPEGKNQNSVDKCYFHGDKRWHHEGTHWYPYVHPFGYIECAVCSCVNGKNEYNCTSNPAIVCPPLQCSEKEAIRKSEKDCCKVCPDRKNGRSQTSVMQGDRPEGCLVNNNFYANGQEWNPRLAPFGTEKCITCKCKNGKTKCRKPKCPKLQCRRKKRVEGECCRVCAEDQTTPRKNKGKRKKGRKRNRNQ